MHLNLYGGNLNLLISYPRSGNTWIRYCIEYFTKRLSIGSFNNPNIVEKGIGYCIPLDVDKGIDPIIYKQHFIQNFQIKNNIIFLIRNFKEVLIKQKWVEDNFFEVFKKEIVKYITLLKKIDKSKNAMIVYYEDLIIKEKFKDIIVKILDKLGYDIDIDEFMKNYNKHKNRCIELYINYIGGSETKGNKEKYYSKRLGKTEQQYDDYVKEKYPYIWEKYLKRYEYRNNSNSN